MKRILTSTLVVAILAISGRAQSYEGTVDYQKKDEKAILIELPYPSSIVEDAIIDKMEKLGFRKKESKGFLLYKNTVLSDISTEPADYLIKVERKSRRESEQSVVYFIVARNEENIIERKDALVNSNAKTFLNKLSPDVEAYNLEVQIKEQENVVSKSEKKLKGLQDDQDGLEKKIKRLEEDLKENSNNQFDQKKEIERQKQILEGLRGQRKFL